jgi:hypothetical protein
MNGSERDGLSDVFVECLPPASACVDRPCDALTQCLVVHRVQWLRTLQPIGSERALIHFRAPDAESVRMVLRRLNLGIGQIWVDEAGVGGG